MDRRQVEELRRRLRDVLWEVDPAGVGDERENANTRKPREKR